MGVAVGIDIAKEFHWVRAIDTADSRLLVDRRVDNEPVALHALVDELQALGAEHGQMRVGIDVVGGIAGLLSAMLTDAGIDLVHVSGLAVNRARQGSVGGEHKSDPKDAGVIADQVRHRRDLRPIDPATEIDAALIRSLPGMGATLTAEFIAEAGSIDRFPTADQLAAAAGLAPVLKQSGKVRYLQRASTGNKTLKRVFFQSAFCSLQHPTSRAFYARKRAERKTHHQAVIALARRRVDVLHAMLRNRQPYEVRPAKAA